MKRSDTAVHCENKLIKGTRAFAPLFLYESLVFYKNISYSELIDQSEYKEFIARFHGIKVVRDGFIVQGFSDGDGGDWLGLSSSSKTTGSFFDFSNDSVIGCVYLTGDKNSVLKETTNREGFVGDKYYVAFKRILNESIKRINKNRSLC